jgi:regulatory protein
VSDLKARAVKLLAQREHTRAELARKLAPLGSAEEIEQVLAALEDTGLQSDARYAEAYLRTHAARFGANRLRQTLRQKGVGAELADTQLAGAGLADEMERARAIWTRKFGAAPADAREWARQARFLQSRGFSGDVVRRLLREPAE